MAEEDILEKEQVKVLDEKRSGEEGTEAFSDAIGGDLLDSMVFDLMPEWLQLPLQFLAGYPWLLIVTLVGLGYLLGKLLQLVLVKGLARLTSKTSSDIDDRLVFLARRPALTVPVILSLLLVTALLPFPPSMHNFIVGLLATILLISLLRTALKMTHVMLELIASKKDSFEIIQTRTIPLFEMSLKLILVGLSGYFLLLIWGIDPTAWLASAGVIGIAIGFAARDTLANLFSGIFIVADAPYKIGDYIVLDTGERGEVTNLGMRSTRLLTRDDVEITIPNAIIANAKIINESGGPWEKHRIRIPVGVAYGSDVDQVVELLKTIAANAPEVIMNPAPRVRMRQFGASSLHFELLCWIERPVMRGRVLHELLINVYKGFNEAGIRIPFPQTDLHVRTMPGEDGDQ